MLAVINIALYGFFLAAREVIPQAIANKEYLEVFLDEGDQWVGSLESKVDLGKTGKGEWGGWGGAEGQRQQLAGCQTPLCLWCGCP